MDKLDDCRQRKAQDPSIDKFHPIFREIIFEHLHSPRLLKWLTRVTGISNLRVGRNFTASNADWCEEKGGQLELGVRI